MAIVYTNDKNYHSIADAIRFKNGEETKYKPGEMAAAIKAIDTGRKISRLNIFESTGMFTIEYEDGGMVSGSATFDENGLPVSLTDDNGNTVNFTSGYPYSATNKNGYTIPILWGGVE